MLGENTRMTLLFTENKKTSKICGLYSESEIDRPTAVGANICGKKGVAW
jgi:hypothetical protein